jgi:hypothetical protein
MILHRLILLAAIPLLIACAPQVELEPAAPEAVETTPALRPVPTATEVSSEEEVGIGRPVEPVTVDLSDITPQTPAARELIVQPSPGVPGMLRHLIEEASDDLSEQLNVSRDTIVVEEAVAVDWPDSSLGCPEPDMAYLTVITPGYWIVLKVAGTEYYYHADTRGRLILCPEEWSVPPPERRQEELPLVIQPRPGAPDDMEKLLDKIKDDLSSRLSVGREAIKVVETQRVQWRDSSLGCPEPGMAYLMVITPGYRIVLEVNGQEHYYNTDENENFVYCPSSQAPIPLDE